MSPCPHKLAYPCEPVGSLVALAKALGVSSEELIAIAGKANNLYRLAKPIMKSDGTIRQPFDALPSLKSIHRKIKNRILTKVIYPSYLTGSLKGKDYKTNAELHVGSAIVICEDIKSFFPSVSDALIFDIWHKFFNFPENVATILTKLTSKDGALPQGAITSSFLANLVLWRSEPKLQEEFSKRGLVYSRYVDDIAISSKSRITKSEQTKAIAQVYGMLSNIGLKAKRAKHETFSSNQRMITTKLVINKRAALPKNKRSEIRSAVFQIEKSLQTEKLTPEFATALKRASVQVGQLGRFHPTEAKRLKLRLRTVWDAQATQDGNASTLAADQGTKNDVDTADPSAPW